MKVVVRELRDGIRFYVIYELKKHKKIGELYLSYVNLYTTKAYKRYHEIDMEFIDGNYNMRYVPHRKLITDALIEKGKENQNV